MSVIGQKVKRCLFIDALKDVFTLARSGPMTTIWLSQKIDFTKVSAPAVRQPVSETGGENDQRKASKKI